MPDTVQFEVAIRAKYGSHYKKIRGKNGLEYKICCPFCLRNRRKPDTGYHLYMNPDKGQYRCFKCPARGGLKELFADISWAERTTFVPPPNPMRELTDQPGTLITLRELPEDHLAIRYLRNRKFNPTVLERVYGVRYCVEGRRYLNGLVNTSNTIIFPIWMEHKVVGWQSRVLFNPDNITDDIAAAMGLPRDSDGHYLKPPKYFTSPGLEKGRAFFNYDVARCGELVVVTEGPMDAIAVGPNAVATMGKGVSDFQARILKAYWKLVVIMLDPGDADKEMQALYDQLWTSVPTLQVKLQGYKDPGDAPTDEIWRQIDAVAQTRGLSLVDYNWGPYWSADVRKE